ncbi:MAG: hypothetical protein JNL54_04150 [Kineosporiaceae bacterium]|nr:hypothetical protein [Kineosporiaceae bacterium]
MTTDPAGTAVPAPPDRALPLVRRLLRPDLARELGWWFLLAVMALIDGIGFWIILTAVLPDTDLALLWTLVGGCALVSVVLPHTAGAILRERHEGYPGSLTGVAVCGVFWAGLGVAMAWTRLTTAPPGSAAGAPAGGGFLGPTGTTTTANSSVVVATLLFMLYVATAVVAFRHAWQRSSPVEQEERELVTAFERVRRAVNVEEYELAVATRRQERARQDRDSLAARRELHYELNDAVAEGVIHQVVREKARRLNDPAANDALAQTVHRRSPQRTAPDPRVIDLNDLAREAAETGDLDQEDELQ